MDTQYYFVVMGGRVCIAVHKYQTRRSSAPTAARPDWRMIDEIARLGWLELERYCMLHSDRCVRDICAALGRTEPIGECQIITYSFPRIVQLPNGRTEVWLVTRVFYLDDVRKN